jgi:hypothetical protein
MRRGIVVGILVLARAAPADPDRVAGLVRQLGDNKYEKREVAARELDAIGEPALCELFAATASEDPEVRARAERIIGSIRARAGERELARWAGHWKTPDGVWLQIDGQRWSSATPTWGPNGGAMWVVDVGPGSVAADMLVEYGPNRGETCRAIYKLDGDRLRYCGTYTPTRATEFKALGGYYLIEFRRGRK